MCIGLFFWRYIFFFTFFVVGSSGNIVVVAMLVMERNMCSGFTEFY
jgi:hypothetical protein